MISPQQVEEMIKAQMPDAQVQVQDLTGGGDHYQVQWFHRSLTARTGTTAPANLRCFAACVFRSYPCLGAENLHPSLAGSDESSGLSKISSAHKAL